MQLWRNMPYLNPRTKKKNTQGPSKIMEIKKTMLMNSNFNFLKTSSTNTTLRN